MLAATLPDIFSVLNIQNYFFQNFILWCVGSNDFYLNFNKVSNYLLLSGVKWVHGDVFGDYVAFLEILMIFSDMVGGIYGVALRAGGHDYG